MIAPPNIGLEFLDKNKDSSVHFRPKNILTEADELVSTVRQGDYGHPHEDFTCATTVFNTLMARKYKGAPGAIQPEDQAIFMICVKLAREMNRPKRDNMVDLVGYAATYMLVIEKQAEGK